MKRRLAFLAALLCASAAHAETWHVNSQGGNDAATGLAPDQAWRSLARLRDATLKPGDTILLADDSVWRESLLLTRSGSDLAPITVMRSGGGKRPRIDAGGVAENAVEIRNAHHIALSGLEITNTAPQPLLRRGVFVNMVDFGVAAGIALRDLYIHDINGTNDRKDNGGIIFSAIGQDVPTRFEGILIERNIIWKVDRSGIAGISDQVSVARWFPSRFVIIRDNVLEDIGGDGIVPRGTDGTLVEHNIVRHAARRAAGHNVAIWQWSTDNTLIQLNEAAFTHGIYDGQGFDSDFNSRNTTFLYNFSHDNEGGFLLICTAVVRDPKENIGNIGTVARYNVSRNDHERIIQLAGGSDALIEKNVIRAGKEELQMVVATWWSGWSERITLRDNKLETAGTARYGYETGRTGAHYIASPGFPPPLSVTFSGNTYAGNHSDRPVDDLGKVISVEAQPSRLWAVPVLDMSKPDDLPEFLNEHRAWMLRMLRRELDVRPMLELPRLMLPAEYRRR